jgi:hypothetical protein
LRATIECKQTMRRLHVHFTRFGIHCRNKKWFLRMFEIRWIRVSSILVTLLLPDFIGKNNKTQTLWHNKPSSEHET